MQILPSLSHMPFKDGDSLYFCESSGSSIFRASQTATALSLNVPAQETHFQPWSLARLNGSAVEPLAIAGMEATAPNQVFCNPVVVADTLSFVHGGSIYTTKLLTPTRIPTRIRSGIFTGFSVGTVLVYALPSCVSKGNFVIESPSGRIDHSSSFDSILRIIPHGDNSLIITGVKGSRLFSVLWNSADEILTIKANGADVYKCCIDGLDVIHAVRASGFEERYLHRDTLELVNEH